MKAVIQRVRSASLVSGGKTVSEIGKGLFILLGVRDSDSEEDSRLLAAKCSGIRLFEDDRGKMNLSVDRYRRGDTCGFEFYSLRGLQKRETPFFYIRRSSRESETFIREFREKFGL